MINNKTSKFDSLLWIKELYQWADEHDIPELQKVYCEEEQDDGTVIDYGFWVGLPRNDDLLRSITELDLSWHNCSNIPSQLRHLTQLKVFRFSKRQCGIQPPFYKTADKPNKISEIPSWICELENLEELDLSYNEIQFIPKELGKLSKLKKLYLNGNDISFIGESLQNLENLEELHIIWNRKPKLSDITKKNLKKLRKLWFHGLPGAEFGVIEKCKEGLKWNTDDGYEVRFIRHENEKLDQEGLAYILSSLGIL